MTARTVIRMGHPTLKLVAQILSKEEILSEQFKELLNDLYDTMKLEGGIGIAAPQINISKQVALIEIPKNSERYGELSASPLLVIINPIITYLDHEKQGFFEGCLSVPGLRGFVERPRKIQVDYLNEKAEPQSMITEDFLATVFQHELDHLFGTLYIERMTDLSKLSFTEEFDQFHKKNKSDDPIE